MAHVGWYLLGVVLFFRISILGFLLCLVPSSASPKRVLIFCWIAWWAILQGLGAQLEGGNINLLLMYFLFEGPYWILKSQKKTKKYMVTLAIGLLMCWLPVVFKPYLGLLSCGITIWVMRRCSWKLIGVPVLVFFVITLVPILFKGTQVVFLDYRNWLNGDVQYIDCAFTLKCNAVNYSILSYFYHIHSWTLESLFFILLTVSALSLCYSGLEKNLLRLFSVLCLVTFLVSPASFPYTMMLLWFPILWATRLLVLDQRKGIYLIKAFAILFLASLIFLNPTYIGREFFNQVVVPYRVTSFFVALGLIPLFAKRALIAGK